MTYAICAVEPYSKRLARAVKKERKLYFFDWTQVPETAKRFENYVACELKSRVELWTLLTRHRFELHFVRTRDGKETDFLVTRDGDPYLLIEVKVSAREIEPHHLLHARKLGGVPLVQLVLDGNVVRAQGPAATVVSAGRFL